MKAPERHAYFRQVLLVTWGMVTLVLLFCVAILIYEMIQRGQNPLDIVEMPSPSESPRPLEALASGATEEVLLYFASAEGRGLAPESCRIPFSNETVDNCRQALVALIRGPRERDLYHPILSEATGVRALYLLEGGELVIDFSRELVVAHKNMKSTSLEALMVYGIVQTLTQMALKGPGDESVQHVRFLVEGAPPRDTFPAHLDVSEPVAPDRQWLVAPPA